MGARRTVGMIGTRKSNLLGKITVLFVICCFCLPVQAKYGGGKGEPNNPYLIYTAEQMNAIGADANDWDECFKLMADIDLSGFTGTSFNIIGYRVSSSDNKPFTGVFDGNDHTISNFTYTSTNTDNIGLFGYVDDSNAVIEDLGLIDPNVDAGTGRRVGSLLGQLQNGAVTGCFAEGGSVSGNWDIGGLVGRNNGTITNCYSNGNVAGGYNVGGLVGMNRVSRITNCYSSGSVEGNTGVGGLVGDNWGTINNCYSNGNVAGGDNIGGLVGKNEGTISNCYATGSVSGVDYVGGLVGYGGVTVNSFWDIEASGQTTSFGGTGKTTEQMQELNTFLYWGACGNQGVWTINDGNDYPRLVWQNLPGVLIVTYEPVYGGGSGTEADPYQIWTAEQLNKIGLIHCHLDKHFKLMSDIDLSGFTGTSFNIIVRFTGTFDGNGHTISNFTYTSTGTSYIGLFGYVLKGEIKDIGLIDPNLDTGTGEYVGSLVGELRFGTITGCYVEGGCVSGHSSIGGLWGMSWISTITNCYSTTSVSGGSYVGGLAGSISYGSITNCYSSGDVSGGSCVGGMAGGNFGNISDCYATGSVSGDDTVGGLVGQNGNLIFEGTITNCYSAAHVMGTTNFGGLVGLNLVMVSTSFWDIQTSGQQTSAGGVGKTTAEMQAESTFTDAGWDFLNIWEICEGQDYPRLSWEKYGGGSGIADNPYLIYTSCQMNEIGADPCDWDKHFKLMADIDLGDFTEMEFNIIGNGHYECLPPIDICWFVGTPFAGVFDGNGHTICNFTYQYSGNEFVGLFGCVDGENAQIKNLGLRDVDIDADGGWIGSLIGLLFDGTVIGCYIQGGSLSGGSGVGGMVGENENGTISHCVSTVNISNASRVGGLVGSNYGTISNCYSKASLIGLDEVGGLAGVNLGTITDCFVDGSVSGDRWVGGLVGEQYEGIIANCNSNCSLEGELHIGGLAGHNHGTIANCYSTGSISGDDGVGGLVGLNWAGIITNCYSNGNFEGERRVGGLVGINSGTTTDCYSTGSVSGATNVGGLVGYNNYYVAGIITNCYATCDVEGAESVGGLVGFNEHTVVNCYSTSSVSGTTNVGGLVGINENGTVTDSFWDVNTSGLDFSDGGVGKTTVEMQTKSTFTDAGWDFVGETVNGPNDIWDICERTNYPRLVWQIPPGDFLCPDGVNFFDYSFFASHWAEDNCGASNDCDGTDLNLLGTVENKDLRIFADNWLRGF
jgi:hypothetical protein